jgi:prolyl oligopeptidase
MRKGLLLFAAICLFSEGMAQYVYPPTKTVDSSDTYFGVTYRDPYRWLEYMKEPQVETWFKQQAAYTDSILKNLNARDELIAEWKQVDKQFPIFYSNLAYENGRLFYRKTITGESFAKLYYRDGMNGKEQLLFDPTTYVPGKKLSLEGFTPSPDGKKVGLVYSEEGAEIGTLKVMLVDTKQFLADSIRPSIGIRSWTFDSEAFFYTSLRSGDRRDAVSGLNAKAKLHILGKDVSDDADFFSKTSYPELDIDPKMFPFVSLYKDSKDYIFVGLGSTQRELTQYYATVGQLSSKRILWNLLCKASDKLVNLEFIKDDVYAISLSNAPNYKVVATSLAHPDWANAITVAPEKSDWTVKGFIHTKDYLLIVYSDGINYHLSKYNLNSKITSDVKLPYSGTISIDCINTNTNICNLVITSWLKPYTSFDYDATTDAFSPSSFNKPFVYPSAYSELQVEEVEVTGHDGAMIPLTIIYSKGIRKDGSSVCLLEGYGAYGTSLRPNFDYFKNSLAARGVVIAIAHVRGGGERGEPWHKAGFKTTKPNTWKDFISCAEYLIAKGYTSAQKLAGIGTSAGGILISRAITERPDLFAGAICNVGAANTMRSEFTANGPGNIPEFGTVKDSVECKALYEMDGVQHVVKGTKYPAVICVGGWNDARVPAWEPGKFAAALQNASSSGKPVIMKVNYDNGHFTEDRNVTMANFANQYAFVLWQCGHPDFQPKKRPK